MIFGKSYARVLLLCLSCLVLPCLANAETEDALQPDQCNISGGCSLDAHGAISATAVSSGCSAGANGCYDGVRSAAGAAATAPVDVYASFSGAPPVLRCRYINNGTAQSLFVGFSTPGEWGPFITNGPSGNPGLQLVNCTRPQNGLTIYASSNIGNIWTPRTPIAATPATTQTVDELAYYPCTASGSSCTAPYAPSWIKAVTFNYVPPAPGGPWVETATATFKGQNADVPGPSWILSNITYATSTGGQCGPSNGASLSSPPTSGFCNAGAFIDIDTTSPMGPWSWQCNVYQPNPLTAPALANCSATMGAQCGPANGTVVASAPSSGLCSIGAASAVSGSGPWSWTCTQAASTVSCSASPILPTGTWTAATGCAGPDLITSYSCQGGNGLCSGAQPSDVVSTNDPSCVTATGTWTPISGCVGTDLVTNYSCQGGNGICSGAAPASTTSVGDPSCSTPPTGTWTPASACSGADLITTYSCQGGNGMCAGAQPASTTSTNDPSCGGGESCQTADYYVCDEGPPYYHEVIETTTCTGGTHCINEGGSADASDCPIPGGTQWLPANYMYCGF